MLESFMFTPKVKVDGRLFLGSGRKGHVAGRECAGSWEKYHGLVFDSGPADNQNIKYGEAEPAFFKSEELAGVPGNVRLIPIGRKA